METEENIEKEVRKIIYRNTNFNTDMLVGLVADLVEYVQTEKALSIQSYWLVKKSSPFKTGRK